MAELLTDDQLTAELADLPEWTAQGVSLVRAADLPSFRAAIDVVDRVADVAERMDHHPDVDIRWRKLVFRCSTHSAGGITALDVSLAHEIDRALDAPA
ncbi:MULTISPECIES: 4a-hydroxytetrahydrobiopterin dehydratase [Actinosynnema]|uniref:Putative pterin-4-alpha-carbinolamine dehydratase n=1 Tax=Actinosynnema pretiosum TaxID=42197 RepID=A0A290Z0L3_9PSEU|nr:4a-hydroxytetrahydrobiopterin dehydratase [Actinosynnema pretiosum]ATE52499.1 4a-hydroxytetrahydrobiopterin dehydratase [Actinosynnema pretiosum]